MNYHFKVILGSLIFAITIVVINKTISYFIIGHFPNMIDTRSIILFIIMFIVGIQSIKNDKTTAN